MSDDGEGGEKGHDYFAAQSFIMPRRERLGERSTMACAKSEYWQGDDDDDDVSNGRQD